MTNIQGRSDRPSHVPVGNSGPRNSSPRAPKKTTSWVLGVLREHLEADGFILAQRPFRKEYINIDKQRWPHILASLEENGFIERKGQSIFPGPNFSSTWVVSNPLEPQLCRSESLPKGVFWVICPDCGITKHEVSSKLEAEQWYRSTHLKGVGHQ